MEDDWEEHKIYIIKTLEKQTESIEEIRQNVSKIKQDFASLKTEVKIKFGILAGLIGTASGAGGQAIMNLIF